MLQPFGVYEEISAMLSSIREAISEYKHFPCAKNLLPLWYLRANVHRKAFWDTKGFPFHSNTCLIFRKFSSSTLTIHTVIINGCILTVDVWTEFDRSQIHINNKKLLRIIFIKLRFFLYYTILYQSHLSILNPCQRCVHFIDNPLFS